MKGDALGDKALTRLQNYGRILLEVNSYKGSKVVSCSA